MELARVRDLLTNRYFIMLLIITVLGTILRFYRISYQSLWIDEGATYFYCTRSVLDILTTAEQTPPPFYVLEHYSYILLGHSELALRLPAVLFGIASIVAIYFLGKEACSKDVGILAALLLSLSPFHILFSQTARSYSIMLFFFILFLLFFIKALKTDSRKDWMIATAFAVLSSYFHFYSVLFVGLAGLFLMMWNKKNKNDQRSSMRNAFFSFKIFIVLSIPLFISAAMNYGHIAKYSPGSAAYWDQGLDFTYSALSKIFYSNLVSFLVFTIVILFCLYCIYKHEKGKIDAFIFFMASVPLLVLTGMSFYYGMDARYAFFLVPVYYLVFSMSIRYVPAKYDKKKIAAVAAGFIVISSVAFLTTYYTTYSNADFRGAGEALYANTEPGDTVIYLPPAGDTMYGPLSFYYDADSAGTTIFTVYSQDLLNGAIEDAPRDVYLVVCYQNGWGVDQYADWISENTEEIFSGYQISVFKCII